MTNDGTIAQRAEEIRSDWETNPRWNGIERDYSPHDVVRLQGSFLEAHTIATMMSEQLWQKLNEEDYINALGTSTPLGDLAETLAILKVFGRYAQTIMVSSTKGAVGHSLGASGGLELVAMVLAVQQGVAPPTVNLEQPGEGCALDYCPNTARDCRIRVAMSNSFGFGGHNACILIRRFDE